MVGTRLRTVMKVVIGMHLCWRLSTLLMALNPRPCKPVFAKGPGRNITPLVFNPAIKGKDAASEAILRSLYGTEG